MIQDIFPLVMKNEYDKKVPASNDRVLSFHEDCIFVREGGRSDYLCYGELADWCRVNGESMPAAVYLFSLGECAYFLASLPEAFVKEAQENGFSFVRMFAMRRKKPKELVFAAATAWHLYVWYRDNRFCGRCGQRLLHSETLRMLSCPCCGSQVFPKIVLPGGDRWRDKRRIDPVDEICGQGVQALCAGCRLYGNRGDGRGDGAARGF